MKFDFGTPLVGSPPGGSGGRRRPPLAILLPTGPVSLFIEPLTNPQRTARHVGAQRPPKSSPEFKKRRTEQELDANFSRGAMLKVLLAPTELAND